MPEWVVFLAGGSEDTSYDWLEDAAILVEGDVAKIVGHGAEAFVYFYINGKAVSFSDRQVVYRPIREKLI